MKLHENNKLFRQAVQATAQQLNIPDIYVEKDYWVTYALHTLFHSEIADDIVFKGGTALSKCYKLIERFSEDIDLVVIRKEGETNNQLTNKIRKVSRVVYDALPEVEINNVTQKMGMNRKTAHTYAKEFKGNYGQVRDVVIVETTWLGYHEPYATQTISSYIFEMMEKAGQQELAEEYGLLPFDVQVLDAKRTLCEKIMSLVRFSHSENALEDLNKKIRHTYDIHRLLENDEIKGFFNSKDFDKMILKVAQDDVSSYKNANEWLQIHPKEAILFSDLENIWGKMKSTYTGEFSNLVYGDFPNESLVAASLNTVAVRLAQVEWSINLKT